MLSFWHHRPDLSGTGACPCPHLSRLFPPTAFSLLEEAVQSAQLACRDTLSLPSSLQASPLPFPFHLTPESFTKGFSLDQKQTNDCKEKVRWMYSFDLTWLLPSCKDFKSPSWTSQFTLTHIHPFFFCFQHMPLSRIIHPHLLFLGSVFSFWPCS